MYLWPQVSSPPAAARTGTSTRPWVLTRRSNVLRRIAPPGEDVANGAGKRPEAGISHNLLTDCRTAPDCAPAADTRQIRPVGLDCTALTGHAALIYGLDAPRKAPACCLSDRAGR